MNLQNIKSTKLKQQLAAIIERRQVRNTQPMGSRGTVGEYLVAAVIAVALGVALGTIKSLIMNLAFGGK
jgi:predicted Kef-type K+ transport protein